MTSATIFTEFSRAAEQAGDRAALATPQAVLTSKDLRHDVLSLAARLAGHDRQVAVLDHCARHLLTAFFACAAAGRPALVLDPARPALENHRLAARHGADLLAPPGDPTPPSPVVSLPRVDGEAEFYWGQTSGTTGEPKLFARSHRSWLASFSAAEQVFAFPSPSTILIPGPLSHSLFLYGAVHGLCRGHTVLAPGVFRPDRAAMAARDADCAYVVPAMLSEMLDCGLASQRLRLIFCGGAKLAPELRQRCEARLPDADLIEFYGASETSFVSFTSTAMPAPAGSVGKPFPGVEVLVGDTGEIHVSSPMLFSRYVGEARAGRWFSAGDTGFIDPAGFLHLTGRVSRIINSRALKIRPEPIEQALLELPGIVRAAVVGLPDATRGAVAVAAVEFEHGARLPRRMLSQHCRTRLGARFSPHRYYQAAAMPLTRSGKIALADITAALMSGSDIFREIT